MEDEEDYWDTHPWEKIKKDVREFFRGSKEKKMREAMEQITNKDQQENDDEDEEEEEED